MFIIKFHPFEDYKENIKAIIKHIFLSTISLSYFANIYYADSINHLIMIGWIIIG